MTADDFRVARWLYAYSCQKNTSGEFYVLRKTHPTCFLGGQQNGMARP